jgi:acyl-CoA thioesterase II
MAELWDDLLSCLKLRRLVTADAADDAIFEGENLHLSYHRLFGGQLLAQFVTAASLTSPGKAVKSLHTLFPREGLSEEPVRYEVTRHHEGGTFATLSVIARQSKGVIATASVSMHTVEAGRSLQAVAPVSHAPETDHRVELGLIPWETRSAVSLELRSGHPAHAHRSFPARPPVPSAMTAAFPG